MDDRENTRAARVAALYILAEARQLPDIPKTRLAEGMGISRWTLDKDLATVAEVREIIGRILSGIEEAE